MVRNQCVPQTNKQLEQFAVTRHMNARKLNFKKRRIAFAIARAMQNSVRIGENIFRCNTVGHPEPSGSFDVKRPRECGDK